MKIAYYPGCSGLGTSLEYDTSSRAVCKALQLDMADVPDWSCCGSTPAHCVDHGLSGALSARNLYQAQSKGAEKVATPCPSCLANLKTARHRMQSADFAQEVHELLDLPKAEQSASLPETFSVLQLLVEEVGLEAIKKRVVRPLKGLKVAPYYGCLMSRPPEIMNFDDPENPVSMDQILEAIGLEVVPFSLKVECCGAAMGIPRREVTARLSGRILETARAFGADLVAVACPLCQMNLDLRQPQAESALKTRFDLPVVYFTQLMGLAFGLDAKDLLLEKLCVSPAKLYEKLAAATKAQAEEEAKAAQTAKAAQDAQAAKPKEDAQAAKPAQDAKKEQETAVPKAEAAEKAQPEAPASSAPNTPAEAAKGETAEAPKKKSPKKGKPTNDDQAEEGKP